MIIIFENHYFVQKMLWRRCMYIYYIVQSELKTNGQLFCDYNAKSKYDYRKNKAPTVLSVRAKSQEIRKLTFKI